MSRQQRRHHANPNAESAPRPEHFRETPIVDYESVNTKAVNARLSAQGRCPECHLLEPHVCLEKRDIIAGARIGVATGEVL